MEFPWPFVLHFFLKKEGITLKRIIKYVLKYKLLIIIPTIAMLLNIGLDLVTPYLSKELVDKAILGGDGSLVTPLLLGILGITIVRAITGYIKEYLFDVLGTDVHRDIKVELFKHIQILPFKYFDNINTGELMSRIGEDVENIWQTLSFGLRLFIENAIYFVFGSIALLYINYKLALACILIMIPIAFVAVSLEKKEGKIYDDISDQNAELNTTAEENIAGVRLVKAFAREKHEILKFLNMNKTYYKLNMKQAKVLSNHLPLMEFLTNLSIVIMITLGGYFVIKGELTIGELVAFNGYIFSMIWSMRMLGWLTNMLAQNKASAKKIFKILDTEPEIKNKENCITPAKIGGEIEFKNVDFKYNNEEILNDINFKVAQGSTIAIMGTTGSGKSSLVNLIGRYYDVLKGEVLIDGVDVRDLDIYTLRNSMAVVPQEVFLFSDTIEENLKLGMPEGNLKDIKEACSLACAEEFINELPKGYETIIGERGIGLSGGQKQRLSIARALIKKAPILILDDSTSALDMETEFQLLKNLNERKKGSTTFIIAHRISAVKNADIILFMDNGRIAERGTHEELLKLKGKYYEIYKEQFKDFVEDVEGREVV